MYYILAALLMLCASAAAPAQDNAWYQVEVVIFQHDDAADTENWPDDPGVPDTADSVNLLPPGTTAAGAQAVPAAPAAATSAASPVAADAQPPSSATAVQPPSSATAAQPPAAAPSSPAAEPFHLLADDQLQLGGAVERLDGTSGYRVLYHAAWRQPAYDPDHSRPVHILVDPLADTAPADAPTGTAPPPAVPPSAAEPVTAAPPAQPPAPPPWLLNGTITLNESRYLHLDVDLLFQQQVAAGVQSSGAAIGDGDAVQNFRMQQSRRVTTGTLYYFDHPRFGVLAQVTPYQPPAASGKNGAQQPAATSAVQ